LRAGRAEGERALASAEACVRHFPGAQGDALLRGLAEAALSLGDPGKARRLWEQLARRRPADVFSRFRLFELALQEGKDEEERHWLGEVQKLEGGGPLAAFGDAACAGRGARRGERGAPAEARRLPARAGAP